MVDKVLLMQKINKVEYHLSRVERFKQMSREEFSQDQDAKDIVVLNLFAAIQYLIDIMTHMIADDEMGEIAFISDCADILYRNGIIDKEYREKIKDIVGFRNIIAHQYGTIQYKIVYDVMQNGIKDISRIIRDIMDYCNL